jgi:hypothetical protein
MNAAVGDSKRFFEPRCHAMHTNQLRRIQTAVIFFAKYCADRACDPESAGEKAGKLRGKNYRVRAHFSAFPRVISMMQPGVVNEHPPAGDGRDVLRPAQAWSNRTILGGKRISSKPS